MIETIAVVMGGGIGAIIRFLLYQKLYRYPSFSILGINILGTFALGLSLDASLDPIMEIFLRDGLLGSLTTFSTILAITYSLQAKNKFLGIGYFLASVIICPWIFYLTLKL